MRRRIFLFCLLLVQFAGLSLFLKGFFPVKKALPGSASSKDLPPEPGNTEQGYRVPAVFDRLVILLIDALKADFVFNDTRMSYTRDLIDKNNSFSAIALANSPTVTMPRIKGLMTGGIPSFIDFLFNSLSTALQEDNLVTQLVAAGKKIVFFGDDTWLKLFPGHFLRNDGTTPFFVTDYTEVDNNVTRHLDKELQSTDWDIMVLHYLGLDHIGHLAGPNSPLVGPKLQEMDNIIEKIHRSLLKNDHERGTKSLLLICGDHGMSDSGSHGGATLPETLTPFVFLSSQFQNGQGFKYSEKIVNQIDGVSTLATILGVPIPQNSVGHVIPELLTLYNPRDKLRALQINAKQLTKVLQANGHKAETYWELEEAYRLHQRWLESLKANKQDQNTLTIQSEQVVKHYMKAISAMSDEISASLSCYDLHAMVSGIAILLQVFGWLVSRAFCDGEESRKIFTIGDLIPSVSFLFVFGACLMVTVGVHLSICSSTMATGTCSSDILCSKKSSSVIFSLILIIYSSLSLSSVISFYSTIPPLFLHKIIRQLRSIISCPIKSILVAGTTLHILSLFSSSFVEEEHQTWYFFIKTYFIVSFCVSVKRYLDQGKTIRVKQTNDYQNEIKNCTKDHLLENHFNVNASNNFAQQDAEEKNTESCLLQGKPSDGKGETLLSLLGPLFCLVLVRVSRNWNQTGIKWVHLPDVGDWLMLPENQLTLSLVSISSLCVILYCTFKRTDFITLVIQSVGLLFVYNYRVATGTVWSPWTTSKPKTLGLTEARVAYGCSFVLLVISIVRFSRALKYKHSSEDYFIIYKTNLERALQTFYASFIVVVVLVTRAHSFFVLAVFVVQQCCLDRCFRSSKTNVNSWTTYLVYLWFGQAAYFTLGKSNSLTTVDLAAGYIGLQAHDDVAVTFLLLISTYSGPLLWMAALVCRVVKNSTSQKQLYNSLYDMCVTYALHQSLLLCVYTTLVYGQRYHLFVWSVFSPKLMFLTVKAVVMSTSITIVLITSALTGRSIHQNKTD